MSRAVRAMVVDDDPRVRRALGEICGTDPLIEVVAEAGDGYEALERARSRRVDVIVLDIRMPRLDGLATLEALRRDQHPARVLVLTSFGETDYVRRAITHDVDGFLLKSTGPHDLLRAIHAVAGGETWLAPAIGQMVKRELRRELALGREGQDARRRLALLSPRQAAVVDHLARGFTNAEIAAALHLTESTVKSYVSSALLRLGLRNRVEAAWLVWQAGRAPAESSD